jgi:hypothetical protein
MTTFLTKNDIMNALLTLPTHDISREKWGKITEAQIRRWFFWKDGNRECRVSCVPADLGKDSSDWQLYLSEEKLASIKVPLKNPAVFNLNGSDTELSSADDVVSACNQYLVPKPSTSTLLLLQKASPVDLNSSCNTFQRITNFLKYYGVVHEIPYFTSDMIYVKDVKDENGRELLIFPFMNGGFNPIQAHIGRDDFITGQQLRDLLDKYKVTIHNPQATGAIYEAISRLARIVNALI